MGTVLQVWWVFPAAIVFATVAIASGVSGALFFSPFFMMVVGLFPEHAIGAGLLTEVFGMGNGLRSYVKQGLVDYATARWLLLGAVPSVIVGTVLAYWVPSGILRVIFGVGLLARVAFEIGEAIKRANERFLHDVFRQIAVAQQPFRERQHPADVGADELLAVDGSADLERFSMLHV